MFNKLAALTAAQTLRKFHKVLSDEDCKQIHDNVDIKELAKVIRLHGRPFNEREVDILTEAAGNMDNDHDYQRDGHRWRDDVLDKYAEYVANYEYQYKPEATDVDPSIDPEETHIGPMAQDLEKVNPAVVQPDPETGYKTVDTGRLALMNAGAIAELARQVKELQNGR